MNANELIKRMEDGYSVSYDEIIAMLRQQQAEIEALKVKNQALKIMNDGKNKIIEEYEHKYPDFFFMENDLMGKR